jgi:hypothetical protein
MYYWRSENFEGLSLMALEADQLGYRGFADYCRLRGKGLRKQAFETLMRFISEMRATSEVDRKKFVDWHQTYCFLNRAIFDASPNPLKEKLIRPTIAKWIHDEPENPLALRWSDDESSMLRAATLNSNDSVAVGRLAVAMLNRIDDATHELPQEYLGDNPNQDLVALRSILELLNGIKETDFFHALREEALNQMKLIQNYLEGSK